MVLPDHEQLLPRRAVEAARKIAQPAVADVETVGLNVRADNPPAIQLYESMGFVRHCQFYEGLATVRK